MIPQFVVGAILCGLVFGGLAFGDLVVGRLAALESDPNLIRPDDLD